MFLNIKIRINPLISATPIFKLSILKIKKISISFFLRVLPFSKAFDASENKSAREKQKTKTKVRR